MRTGRSASTTTASGFSPPRPASVMISAARRTPLLVGWDSKVNRHGSSCRPPDVPGHVVCLGERHHGLDRLIIRQGHSLSRRSASHLAMDHLRRLGEHPAHRAKAMNRAEAEVQSTSARCFFGR